ncbi:unnamed protein product, partial [marine sediment metagenome]
SVKKIQAQLKRNPSDMGAATKLSKHTARLKEYRKAKGSGYGVHQTVKRIEQQVQQAGSWPARQKAQAEYKKLRRVAQKQLGVTQVPPETLQKELSKEYMQEALKGYMERMDIPPVTQQPVTQQALVEGGPMMSYAPGTGSQFQASVQQYKGMGFSQKEAERIATVGSQQMVDFTYEGAKAVARPTISEKVPGAIRDIGSFYGKELPLRAYEKVKAGMGIVTPYVDPLIEKEIRVQVGPKLLPFQKQMTIQTGVTYEEAASLPIQAIKWEAEKAGEMYAEGYEMTIAQLPEEYQP